MDWALPCPFTPAKVGVRKIPKRLDSRLRGNDVKGFLFGVKDLKSTTWGLPNTGSAATQSAKKIILGA